MFQIVGAVIAFWLFYALTAACVKHKISIITWTIIGLAGGIVSAIFGNSSGLLVGTIVGAPMITFFPAFQVRSKAKDIWRSKKLKKRNDRITKKNSDKIGIVANHQQDEIAPKHQQDKIIDNQHSAEKVKAPKGDEKKVFEGFMGMPMDKKNFAKMQKENPWFFVGMFNQTPPLDLLKMSDSQKMTDVELLQCIFAKIFGSFGIKQDLDDAEDICKVALEELEKIKPSKNKNRNDDNWMEWQEMYGKLQIQLGTVYAYKEETIKAAYHFMIGLNSEMVQINIPYCDFIRHIVAELEGLPKEAAKCSGTGVAAGNPMGCVFATNAALDAQLAMSVIPEMEGNNGEIIIARKGRAAFYGYLKRLGSTGKCIDIYETWLIDKNYKLMTIKFYFNAYKNVSAQKQIIKLANGFAMKPHSVLHNEFEF